MLDLAHRKELYFSVDVETDGPIPGEFSMLSFGAVAYDVDVAIGAAPRRIDTHTSNLQLLPNAKADPKTMEFWKKHPAAYEKSRTNLVSPLAAMTDFTTWVNSLCHEYEASAVMVGFPVAFDYMFLNWYLHKFLRASVFSHNALDIKTVAAILLRRPFKATTLGCIPTHWFNSVPHTHVALEDALAQGELFCTVWQAARQIAQEAYERRSPP